MESLKAPKKPKHRSKVRQFYSDFNSDESSNSPKSSSESENEYAIAQVFTFDKEAKTLKVTETRTPKSRSPRSARSPVRGQTLSNSEPNVSRSRPLSYFDPPKSPALSPNQVLKDEALGIIFQKKIKDLQSKPLQTASAHPLCPLLPPFYLPLLCPICPILFPKKGHRL